MLFEQLNPVYMFQKINVVCVYILILVYESLYVYTIK